LMRWEKSEPHKYNRKGQKTNRVMRMFLLLSIFWIVLMNMPSFVIWMIWWIKFSTAIQTIVITIITIAIDKYHFKDQCNKPSKRTISLTQFRKGTQTQTLIQSLLQNQSWYLSLQVLQVLWPVQ
jgi:hypothetical protein